MLKQSGCDTQAHRGPEKFPHPPLENWRLIWQYRIPILFSSFFHIPQVQSNAMEFQATAPAEGNPDLPWIP